MPEKDDDLHETPTPGRTSRLIAVHALAELVYCARKYYYGRLQGETGQSVFIERGRAAHAAVDRPAQRGRRRHERAAVVTRSLELASERLGLAARLDILMESARAPDALQGEAVVVEHKRGKGRDPAYDEDRVQVGAQILLLREAGFRADRGVVFYRASRTKVDVAFDSALEAEVHAAIARARDLEAPGAAIPPVIEDRQRCSGCRFVGICLPEEVAYVHKGETRSRPAAPEARVVAGKATGETLYVDRQGAKLGIRGESLEVRDDEGEVLARQPLEVLDSVVVAGMVGLTTYAISALLARGIAVSFVSVGGRFKGALLPASSRNGLLRLAQARAVLDDRRTLAIARAQVAGKIQNQRAILQRQGRRRAIARLTRPVARLAVAADSATKATDLDTLRGIEGSAARLYFAAFSKILGGPRADPELAQFDGRRRRPPPDAANALLSYVYSLLTSDVVSALHVVGLDPYVGLLHGERYGQPSLALDLVEEFRPVIADSMVLRLVNNGELSRHEFHRSATGVLLTETGRKMVFRRYAERKANPVQHPVFGYTVAWSRILEVQARLLAKVLTGELEDYVPFVIR